MVLERENGQGSLEYLLIFAAVIVVVATTAHLIGSGTPSAMINGVAEIEDNKIVFVPSETMTPPEIPAGEWKWTLYRDGMEIEKDESTQTLKAGERVVIELSGTINPKTGDELKIWYKDTWHDAATLLS